MSRTSRRRHRLRPGATELGRSSRSSLSALVAGAVALALPLGVLAGADPAAARSLETPGPDYELPFPCGQTWVGTSRARHQPSPLSVDLNRAGDLGDLVVATAPGVVTRVADTGTTSYGRYVIVDHGGGHSSLYAHLRRAWTTPGRRVDQGTVLGVVGASGGVTGPHLHFEQRLDSRDQPVVLHEAPYSLGAPVTSTNCPDVPLAGDWDGDGDDEVAVFRRGSIASFRLREEAAVTAVGFGRSSDTPVAGDWDGDGTTDVGVWRPGRRSFLLRQPDGSTLSVRLGRKADVPVTGDWDGDGTTDVGAWRPRTGAFRLRTTGSPLQVLRLGAGGVLPVTGDWDGDRGTDLGVYDPTTATFSLRRADGSVSSVALGSPGDLPVTGDWNGDGLDDVGTWTPATATYALRTAPSTGRRTATVTTLRFGKRR
ncbi:MAG TPA: peptidoglycan DD-metalloendopeptidase family protein [Nocardioidaceae bacterium]|jgi:hypothetical protein|nr:peptidoglycan DD-metalloendopeptidase family protein [Nocardioidaceae bacterium]